MMKTNYGGVSNAENTIHKSIDVETVPVNSLKDALIGGGLTLLGIAYIAITSFKNGSKAYGIAETNALHGVGAYSDEGAKAVNEYIKSR